ncbi:MAG: choice-of-anchor Q domain-containing protein [Rhodanobacteraceae bacterium]
MQTHAANRKGRNRAPRLCAIFLLILAGTGLAHANICRVTTGGSTGGTGTWGFPMALQTALTTSTCTEVWVAAGVYKPGTMTTDTFNIQPGVAVYGGFAGNETSRGERDPAAHITILSGDIDNNDTYTNGNNIVENYGDVSGSNSYHIITMDGTGGTSITASTVLDGFTITGGVAYSTQPNGGGLHCSGQGSGRECSPTLSNLTFSGNSALSGSGGAIYNDGTSGGTSSPILSNVTFSGNGAQTGGAMYNGGENGTSSPILSNVTFSGNTAYDGGAMVNWGINGGTSSPTLSNVTFNGNDAYDGGAMANVGNSGNSVPALSNAILWGDTAINSHPEIYNISATPVIDHSVVQGSGGSAGWDMALGTDGGGNLGTDPVLGPLGIHGGSTATLLLGTGSSAIDAGDDAVCTAAPVNGLDQRGVTRPQGAQCDIGAAEMDTIFADGFELAP